MLTIVIPTYNRGALLWPKLADLHARSNGLKICIIDNASTEGVDEYKKISNYCEAYSGEMRYIRNERNIMFTGSLLKAMQLVDTEYMIILSDEDSTISDLGYLFGEFIKKYGEIIAGRPSIYLENQSQYYAQYEHAVYDSVEGLHVIGLTGNYISGQIYNVKKIREKNLIKIFEDGVSKLIDYPHLAINMICCAHGKTAMIEDAYTIKQDEVFVDELGNPTSHGSRYAGPYSYGGRVNQFLAFRDLMREVLEIDIHIKHRHLFYIAYLNLCKKYSHLVLGVQAQSFLDQGLHPRLMAASLKYLFLGALCNFPGGEQVQNSLEKNIVKILNGYLLNIKIQPIT